MSSGISGSEKALPPSGWPESSLRPAPHWQACAAPWGSLRTCFPGSLSGRKMQLKRENEEFFFCCFSDIFLLSKVCYYFWNLWRRAVTLERIMKDPSKKNLFCCYFGMWSRDYFLLCIRLEDEPWFFVVIFTVIEMKWEHLKSSHTWKHFQIFFFIVFQPKLFQPFAYLSFSCINILSSHRKSRRC